MAENRGFRGRNVAVMAAPGGGCVVAVDGVGRRYDDLSPPEGVRSLCWDRGEGVQTRETGEIQAFTSFEALAPWLNRWASDQLREDAAAAQAALARAAELDAARRVLEAEQRAALNRAIDDRLEARNG